MGLFTLKSNINEKGFVPLTSIGKHNEIIDQLKFYFLVFFTNLAIRILRK